MSVIDRIMSNEPAKWVNRKIVELPDSARFRASNSIRSLNWANAIFYETELPVPACYCALHATEEAVAAFISSAKVSGYGDDAKINIRDHQEKAVISLLCEKLSNIIQDLNPAIAFDKEADSLTARFGQDGGHTYYPSASVNLIHFLDSEGNNAENFYGIVKEIFEGDVANLKRAVLDLQKARNGIFYANSSGYPSGFDNPEESLQRECQMSLGLIWASIDIHRRKGELAPLIVQALRTANLIIAELKKKKHE